jgi:preprotein translocase subunit SecD
VYGSCILTCPPREALIAVSSIAQVAGPTLFARYYEHLMPVVLRLGAQPAPSQHDEQVSLVLGRAFECAGLMAVAVGKVCVCVCMCGVCVVYVWCMCSVCVHMCSVSIVHA